MLKFIAPTTAWLRHVGTAAASVVAVIGILAGLSPEDQTRLLEAVRQFVDGATAVLAAVGTIAGIVMAVWARWTAKPEQQVAAVKAMPNADVVPIDPAKPVTAGAPGAATKVASSWVIGLLALILLAPLAGCAGGPDAATNRQATAASIDVGFTVVKSAATIYTALPRCGSDNATAICSDPAVAVQIAKALTVADAAVAEAKRQILTSSDQESTARWLDYGLGAINVLATALATYGVK